MPSAFDKSTDGQVVMALDKDLLMEHTRREFKDRNPVPASVQQA